MHFVDFTAVGLVRSTLCTLAATDLPTLPYPAAVDAADAPHRGPGATLRFLETFPTRWSLRGRDPLTWKLPLSSTPPA